MHRDFIGRAGELAALEAAWLAAGDDEGAPVVVVHGAPAIGKTRTVTEFARVVEARGTEVLWGTCYEGGDAHPYAVWTEAIRRHVRRLGGAGLRASLGDEARWLEPLVGDIAVMECERPSVPAR